MFPAYAGVFLAKRRRMARGKRVPRIRGGVPVAEAIAQAAEMCSPHTRGCS